MNRPWAGLSAAGLLLLFSIPAAADAGADVPDGATARSSDAAAAPPEPKTAATPRLTSGAQTCVERVPEGKARPKLTETFPDKGLSGHATVLTIVVEHGKGESVLPHGFRIDGAGEDGRALERAGFALPDPDGGAGPSLSVKQEGERKTTTVRLSVVPLPPKPGRQDLTLPPLPIAIERASGELLSVCTQPHTIQIEDPIANTPDPKPRENPEPRPQLEEWTTLKNIVYTALTALLIGAIVAWLLGRWMRRPKTSPPPPPPRPPWEVALEELRDLRAAGLVKRERFVEHYDRVSQIVRRYSGDRYGFDGLESTTREMLHVLRRVEPPIAVLDEIEAFLRHADLVKFARLTPSADECETAMARGELIVNRTIPPPMPGVARRGAS